MWYILLKFVFFYQHANDGNDSRKQHCCRLFKTSRSDSFPSHLTQPIYECTNPDFKIYKGR